MLFLLSGDVSLSAGPTPSSVSQSFWKSFENKGLYSLRLNNGSILPKLEEVKTVAETLKLQLLI